jgi:hypothetical protein
LNFCISLRFSSIGLGNNPEEFSEEPTQNQSASSQMMKYLTQYFDRSLTKLHKDAQGANAYLFGVSPSFAAEFIEKKSILSKEMETRHAATFAESGAIVKAFVEKLTEKSQAELKKIFATIFVLRAPITKWKSPKDVSVNEDEHTTTLSDIGGYVCCYDVIYHYFDSNFFPLFFYLTF